jgi:predicted secreted acid phosphatase
LTGEGDPFTLGDPMALDKELATYQAKLPEMKQHEGKYVLIHGESVVDFFSTYEDAIKAGYQQFKLEPFLVKRVLTTEPVLYITRSIVPTEVVLAR